MDWFQQSDWALQLPIIGEVALAMLLGGAIGVEREIADKPAGFARTCWLLELPHYWSA